MYEVFVDFFGGLVTAYNSIAGPSIVPVWYAPANATSIIAAAGITQHTINITLVNPIRAKRFHRHYSGFIGTIEDHYCTLP